MLNALLGLLIWVGPSDAQAPSRAVPATRAGRLPFPGSADNLSLLIGRQQYRKALIEARHRLADDPDSPDMNAVVAVCCNEYGNYGCVAQHIQESQGSQGLHVLQGMAEADTLRHFGQPREAAELRRTYINGGEKPKRTLNMMVRLMDDYVIADDAEARFDLAWEAMALGPGSQESYALVALAYVYEGNLDEAEAWIWLGRQLPQDSLTLRRAEGALWLARGEPLAALDAIDGETPRFLKDRQLAALRAKALLVSDNASTVLDMLDVRSWYLADTLWDPDLLAGQARALSAMGHTDVAQTILDELLSTYPDYPPVQEAVADLRGK